jgi:hypothetical protein
MGVSDVDPDETGSRAEPSHVTTLVARDATFETNKFLKLTLVLSAFHNCALRKK